MPLLMVRPTAESYNKGLDKSFVEKLVETVYFQALQTFC